MFKTKINLILTALLGLAAAEGLAAPSGSAYTPQVPLDRAQGPSAAPLIHDVQCDAPQTMNDCRAKARQICGGAFVVVRQSEVDHKNGSYGALAVRKPKVLVINTGGGAPQSTVPEAERLLTFKCQVPKSKPEGPVKK